MLKHSYALKMGAKKNNPTLNQVSVKEQKKKIHKRNLGRLYIFLENSPRAI